MIRGLLLALLVLAGCGRSQAPSPVPQPRYVVGNGYQSGGAWYYPREDFRLDVTGLAVILPNRKGLTANGELTDATAMAGAHDTLQLPSIARVTNLETGLQVLVRLNDRGPAMRGRLLGLTPRAAERLGIPSSAVARVRVQIEDGPSQAVRDALGGGGVAVLAAPRDAVSAESLAPPPGTAQSNRGRAGPTIRSVADAAPVAAVPTSLTDTVTRVVAEPGQLYVRAAEFSQAAYAIELSGRLRGLTPVVERAGQGRSATYRVRAGPFADVAQADRALDQAMRAGVTDARIVVE